MSPQLSRPRHLSLRISEAGYQEIRKIAETETSGNISVMARRLLAEAVEHRADMAAGIFDIDDSDLLDDDSDLV